MQEQKKYNLAYGNIRKRFVTYKQAAELYWYSVKKKYKLNANFFHNTILNQQLILIPSTLSNTYPHIHLVRDSHNDCGS